ncbi:unnamed protein product [Microthlaspi erraticum]|uniref:Reverse transcriptase/retrotransposon-derived protein RNase H-like domain-containing protein n=1 Tax=Microthlaspi erraticum TaxID=1685480 RepID=A0A6D2J201_9BRAS|nr:unnamed protein product [Microthlaspi erraticum]
MPQVLDLAEGCSGSAPIVQAPNWDYPFEIMCDASDYAVGAVLGQKIDKKLNVIYYASKTMDDAQCKYATTEKELLAMSLPLRRSFDEKVRLEEVKALRDENLPDFMGPFKPPQMGQLHYGAVDYVSKWIEAICPACDAKVVIKLFRTIIFPRYGIPRVVISDGGSHFINKVFEKLMKKLWSQAQGSHALSPSNQWAS